MFKKIIVVSNGNFFAQFILQDVFKNMHSSIKKVIIVEGDYKGLTGYRSYLYLFRKVNLVYIFYKVFIIILFKILSYKYTNNTFSLVSLCNKYNIDYILNNKVNDKKIVEVIKEIDPELLISVSCPQLIKKRILNIIPQAVNIHSSLLPKYAGLAPYFWVLSKREKKTGITCHFMTSKFDEGNIISQASYSIQKNQSVFSLFFELSKLGKSLLYESIIKISNKELGYKQNLAEKSYYSNPDFKSIVDLYRNGYNFIKINDIKNLINYLK